MFRCLLEYSNTFYQAAGVGNITRVITRTSKQSRVSKRASKPQCQLKKTRPAFVVLEGASYGKKGMTLRVAAIVASVASDQVFTYALTRRPSYPDYEPGSVS